jgi:hypothetical protein
MDEFVTGGFQLKSFAKQLGNLQNGVLAAHDLSKNLAHQIVLVPGVLEMQDVFE